MKLKPSIEAILAEPNQKMSGFFDLTGKEYTTIQVNSLREWGYRIPLTPFPEKYKGYRAGDWDIDKNNCLRQTSRRVQTKIADTKDVSYPSKRKKKSEREPDRDEYMDSYEFQSEFGKWRGEWLKLNEPRPHFMNWFMEEHGDYFSYYLMKPILTSPYNKDALDAMKLFMQYSKQLPKAEISIEGSEDNVTPQELITTLYEMFPPDEIVRKGLDMMGLSYKEFNDFCNSKKN